MGKFISGNVISSIIVRPNAREWPCDCDVCPCPCEGDDCPCEGDDCPCVGDDCPCVGDDCPCEGDDCPCEGDDCPCVGDDCDTCPDFELTVYDEPYCRGNSNVITVEELRTESALRGATSSLAGPIRSVRHPGKTRVDIFSAEQFTEFNIVSRNEKEAVNAVDGNKICMSWRLGDEEEVGPMEQKSLWFRPEDDCYDDN